MTFSPFGGVATDTIKVSGDINVANPRVFAIETTTGLSAVLESDPGIGIPSWTVVAAPPQSLTGQYRSNYLASSADYADVALCGHQVTHDVLRRPAPIRALRWRAEARISCWIAPTAAPPGPTSSPAPPAARKRVSTSLDHRCGRHFVRRQRRRHLEVHPRRPVWTDLTGNLADAEFNSVATDPNNANIILAGGHGTGLDLSTLGAVGQAVLAGATVGSVKVLNGDSGYLLGLAAQRQLRRRR